MLHNLLLQTYHDASHRVGHAANSLIGFSETENRVAEFRPETSGVGLGPKLQSFNKDFEGRKPAQLGKRWPGPLISNCVLFKTRGGRPIGSGTRYLKVGLLHQSCLFLARFTLRQIMYIAGWPLSRKPQDTSDVNRKHAATSITPNSIDMAGSDR